MFSIVSVSRTLTSNLSAAGTHFLEVACMVPAVNLRILTGGTQNPKIQSTR